MQFLLFFAIGYFVLYAVVWLHEIGHSVFDYRFGAKDNWLRVQVKPYIFFSTPGPVDIEVWKKWTDAQHVLDAYGGILFNLLFAALAGVVLWCVPVGNLYLSLALWLFLTLHIAEIVSYLFIGSLYLVSDMQVVHQHMPRLRIPNIVAGLAAAALYIRLLFTVPKEFQLFVVIWNGVTVLSMCLGRIIFSIRAERRKK